MADNPRSPRARIAVPCTLRRGRGSAIAGVTRDIGAGGMCAVASRPLAIDELVAFEIRPHVGDRIAGRARVLRQQDIDLYALAFEAVTAEHRARLAALVHGLIDPRGIDDA